MKRMSMMMSLSLACGTALAGSIVAPAKVVTVPAVAEAVLPASRVIDQPNAILSALKQNDFAALQEAFEQDKDIVAIAKQWNERADRQRAFRAKHAAGNVEAHGPAMPPLVDDTMQQTWQKFQSAAGVDALVDEWQPKIAEQVGKSLLAFNVGFGATLASIASEKKLSAHEVQQLTQLMYAVQNWTGRVDFADRERLRRAFLATSQLVRQTGLKRFDDTQTLAFEDAIVHGDAMLKTVKQVFAAYEVDVDEILNSVRFTEIDALGDKATLRAEARIFGVEFTYDFEMRHYQGQWLSSDSADAAEGAFEAADAAEAVSEAAAKSDTQADPEPESSSTSCSPENEFDDVVDAAPDAN